MALEDFGVQPYGFVRPSLNDIINEYNITARENYGQFTNLGDNSRLGTLFKIFAYQDSQLWGLMEAVYNSRTLSGAEGKYLDDILSRRGIFRRNAEPGTGEVVVQTDRFAPWLNTLSLTTQFTSNNGKTYTPRSVTQFRDNIFAYRVIRSNAVAIAPTITFTIRNFTSGDLVSQAFTTSSINFSADLVTFIQANINPADTSKVFVDSGSDTVYVGFNIGSLSTPTGLDSSIFFYADFNIGTKWSIFEVICTEAGVFPVQVGGITQLTPPFTGYVSTYNYKEFNPGSEVETDAEYRTRGASLAEEALASTKPAIIKAISDLSGVNKVRIYDNPTSVDLPEVDAYSFNTIVYGGTPSEIFETIAIKKPINTLTFGTQSTTFTYEDSSTEIIRYTPATVKQINVRITYSTSDTLPLNSTEISNINESLVSLSDSYIIGGTVTVLQLQAAILSSLVVGRLASLTVEIKYVEQAEIDYTTSDITVEFDQIAVLIEDNIVYNQVV